MRARFHMRKKKHRNKEDRYKMCSILGADRRGLLAIESLGDEGIAHAPNSGRGDCILMVLIAQYWALDKWYLGDQGIGFLALRKIQRGT